MAKSKKNKRTISVNFEGVEARVLVPEDDYKVKATEVSREEGDKAEYLAWKLQIQDGEMEGKTLYTNTSLSENALWRLRGQLEAMGLEVPDGVMDLDLDDAIENGGVFGVTVAHDDYEGRPRAQVVEVFPVGEDDDEKEEKSGKDKEEKSGKDKEEKSDKKGGKGKKKDEEEKPDEDAIMEMDEDELEEVIDTHDLDVDLDDHGTLKKKRKAVWEALEEDDDGEGSDKDDKKGGKKKSDKYSEESIMEMGTKDLKELLEKHDIELELEGSTKSKRRATLKALKKEGLIED